MKLPVLQIAGILLLICTHLSGAVIATDVRIGRTYIGACDASAAVSVDAERFVIATDEMDFDGSERVNRFHVYARTAALSLSHIDVTPAVQHASLVTHSEADKRECDFEGSARVDNRIFWITSHGPNKNGKSRPDRYRLIATDVVGSGAAVLRLVGAASPRPAYANLLHDLADDTRLSGLRLAELAETPPEKGGLNIEGLARTRDGHLLIGLRSPLWQDGAAVLVPLLNPGEIVGGAETKARLGDPIHLDLGARGIRDIVYWRAADTYIIIAGSPGDADDFVLYSWTTAGKPEKLKDDAGRDVSARGMHPESLVLLESGELLVLSDDGDELAVASPATLNKDVPSRQRTFRSLSMKLVVANEH